MSSRLLVRPGLLPTFLLALSAGTIGSQQGAPRPEASGGTISGIVVEKGRAEPLADAAVSIVTRGKTQSVMTDDRGRFVVAGLNAGTYSVSASKAGFSLGYQGVTVMGSLGGPVVLAQGEWRRDIHLELTRFGSLSGRVTNEKGEPVAHAFVRAVATVTMAGVSRLAAGRVTQTDSTGLYTLSGLLPGEYRLLVPSVQQTVPSNISEAELEGLRPEQMDAINRQAKLAGTETRRRIDSLIVSGDVALVGSDYPISAGSGGRLRAYRPTFYPGVSSSIAATTLDVGSGRAFRDIDIKLTSADGHRVSGRFGGEPSSFRGAIARLVPIDLQQLGVGGEQATTLVRPDGSFTFLNVPSGDYWLNAPGATFELATGPAGLALPRTAGASRFGYGASAAFMPQQPGLTYNSVVPDSIVSSHTGFVTARVTVGDTDVTNLTIQSTPSAALEFTIKYEDFPERGPSGSLEIASADLNGTLDAFVLRFDSTSPGLQPVQTLPVVRSGSYGVRAIGMTGATIKAITKDGIDCTYRPLWADAGSSSSIIVTMTSKGGIMSGAVRDAKGQPVFAGAVIMYPVRNDLWTGYGFTPTWIRATSIATNGTYQISGLRAGDYFVVATGEAESDKWSDPAFLRLASAKALRLTINWGDSKTADLEVRPQ